ncbi:MAG: DedA family protein [Acidimicrobiales bacterium]
MDEKTEPSEPDEERAAAPATAEGEEGEAEGEAHGEEGEERPKLPRKKLVLIVAPIVVLAIVGTVTTALTPALAAKHPLLLIMLEARNRNLILAREVDFLPFLLVAILRRTLTDPLYFLLGWYYGDAAVRWLEVKAGLQDYARLMEKVFRKASYPAVFLFPGAVVCALAGVVRMRFPVFLAVNFAGTLTAVIALKAFGDVFASPVEAIVGFFDRNLLVTTAISIVLVTLSVLAGRLQGKMELSMKDIDELQQAAEEEKKDREPEP